MENFDDGKIHHKTIAVRFNNIKTPEEGAEKMDIEINNFLDDLQKKTFEEKSKNIPKK